MIKRIFVIAIALAVLPVAAGAFVVSEEGKTFIVDRLGEKWEITQAVGLGFKPGGFKHGIGRNAFHTLDDTHLSDEARDVPGRTRVIGIAGATEARAYSVKKLTRHEIANSYLDGAPVAVGY